MSKPEHTINRGHLRDLIKRGAKVDAATNIAFCSPHHEIRIDLDDNHFAWLYISEKNMEHLMEERNDG